MAAKYSTKPQGGLFGRDRNGPLDYSNSRHQRPCEGHLGIQVRDHRRPRPRVRRVRPRHARGSQFTGYRSSSCRQAIGGNRKGPAMSARIWNLRFNLDGFNQAASLLGDDIARGVFMRGMALGMNGGSHPEHAPEEFLSGYLFGLSARKEALEHQVRMAKGGRASAVSRRAKYGSAAPNNARTMLEQCSSDARTTLEHSPNQSTIHNLSTYSTSNPYQESPATEDRNVGTRTYGGVA